ncbi:zincin-like metallopeptidase domain-containing protein [Roseivivax lentus]|uniref:zincin-like metallopeptidase domain-containing protein n=1 Tax=Roseivivax lentus TaxID=633194 RepID=UPI00389B1454
MDPISRLHPRLHLLSNLPSVLLPLQCALRCHDRFNELTFGCLLKLEVEAFNRCAPLAQTPEAGTDHAAYIQSWLKVLKNDKRAIFAAAAHAQRAADFLHGFQPSSDEEGEAAA